MGRIIALLLLILAADFAPLASARALPRKMTQAAAETVTTNIRAVRRERHRHAARPVARLTVYRNNYSWFIPYAPPVPHFYPFGYELGYF